jgi:hypothetical protein
MQPHPLIQPQYHPQEYQDPVDPLPYIDYPVPPFHHYPQPEPEPEPEPEPYSHFQFRNEFRDDFGHHPINDIVPPADHLEPPQIPNKGLPTRIFYLFTSRFPWPLEPVVQRVQNYFSTYTVPTVEPLLDEEVDLGPTIEEVDDYESQLSLAGVSTTTTTGNPDRVDGIKPFISSANLTSVKNETDTLKAEESSTEKMDDVVVIETTTTASTTEETTMMTTDGLPETTTTAPISGGDAKKTMSNAMASKLLEDALFSHVLDDTDEIFMHS